VGKRGTPQAPNDVPVSPDPLTHALPKTSDHSDDPAPTIIPSSGLLYLPVPHTDNSQDAPEEAGAIATLATRLLDGTDVTTYNWSESRAITRPLTQDDILIVTPYNAQVRQLKRTLTAAGLDAIRVGPVDKFQGQEAPIVFFSMATSSGEEVPRTLDFLFSRNRLNVAISRAQCLAILVAGPKLLDVHCKTIEQMKLVNSLCRFVEMAYVP
jgi:hypothetical protein